MIDSISGERGYIHGCTEHMGTDITTLPFSFVLHMKLDNDSRGCAVPVLYLCYTSAIYMSARITQHSPSASLDSAKLDSEPCLCLVALA